MVPLELVLLGRPQLILEGRDLTPDVGAKGMALLALLARAAPAPMPRERLARTLWSEKREEAARYRLRHALWDLRRMLGADWIQSDQNACWLDPGAGIKIDLVEFQRGCDRLGIGARQPKATAEDAPALIDLAGLYGGEFLEGLTVREAPVFEEWLLAERERLQLLCQDVLWNLARAQQAALASSDAAQTLVRLIRIDPLRDRHYRALMAVYLAQNDRAAALRVYRQCRETLAAELGAQPSKDTERLHKIISQGHGDSARGECDRANAYFQQGRFDEALAAMTVHYTFNNVALSSLDPTLTEWILVVIGLGGVALVAATILWGLREERKWLREELGEKLHVSKEEASIVQHMGDLDELLAPIEKRFGKNKRSQVARFLHLEAQLGLKQEAEERATDPKLRAELASQIAESEQELDRERRNVGMYVMSFVRAMMPPTDWSLWARLGQALTHPKIPQANLWNTLSSKMAAPESARGVSLYMRVQSELDARTLAATLTADHVDELPEAMKKCMHWVMKEETVALHHVVAGLGHEEQAAEEMLSHLVARGFLHRTTRNGQVVYRSRLANSDGGAAHLHLWQSVQKRLPTHS